MRTFSWLNGKLEVRDSPSEGKGVFAREKIQKDERLAVFGGVILTLQEEASLPEAYRDTGLQIAEDLVLTTKEAKEDTDCFNHSCEPNAGFRGQIFLVAIRDIFPEEEVVFDYAMVLYDGDSEVPYSMECSCGKESCRGVVTANDWKNPDLQSLYHGYFQDFLARRIDKE